MKDKPLRVVSCPLCRIFSHSEVRTKLYWPETIEKVPDAEFAIVDCETCKVPMVIISDHVVDITRECWGRILYRCRKLFGINMKLRTHMRKIRDHQHYHLITPTKY